MTLTNNKDMRIRSLITVMLFAFPFIVLGKQKDKRVLTQKQKKEIIKLCSKKNNPVIVLDGSICLSVQEFLDINDEIIDYSFRYSADSIPYQGVSIDDGLLFVYTTDYKEKSKQKDRSYNIRNYRENELFSFFGYKSPYIYNGKEQLSMEDFLNLPEEDIAFICYYPASSVYEYSYGDKAKAGMVYVCMREEKSQINYACYNGIPANGRNYYWNSKQFDPSIQGNGLTSIVSHVQKKVKENTDIPTDLKAEVTFGCTVHLDGTTEPFIVEDIACSDSINKEKLDMAIKTTCQIIKTMPQLDLGLYILEDLYKGRYINDYREKYIRIPVRFN